MKTGLILLLSACCFWGAQAQVTIVKGALNEDFDLSCAQCSTEITDIALVKGMQLAPYNLRKAQHVNLLHWKYYDSIAGREVTTEKNLPWEKCTQLLDHLTDSDTLSLHLNLSWKDSTTQTHLLYLVLGGLYKSDLSHLPLEGEYISEVVIPHRFAAYAQLRKPDGKIETYDTVMGEIYLQRFDPKTGAVEGTFEFTGNCIGIIKLGIFSNGRFERK